MRRCVAPRCLRLMPRPGAAAAARARASSARAFAAARRRARRPRAAPRGRRPGRRWRGPGAPGRRRSTTRRARRPSASSRGTRPSSVVAAAGGSGLRARAGGRGERTHQRLRRGLRLRLLPPLLRVVRRACDGSTGRRVAASGGGRPRARGGGGAGAAQRSQSTKPVSSARRGAEAPRNPSHAAHTSPFGCDFCRARTGLDMAAARSGSRALSFCSGADADKRSGNAVVARALRCGAQTRRACNAASPCASGGMFAQQQR